MQPAHENIGVNKQINTKEHNVLIKQNVKNIGINKNFWEHTVSSKLGEIFTSNVLINIFLKR